MGRTSATHAFFFMFFFFLGLVGVTQWSALSPVALGQSSKLVARTVTIFVKSFFFFFYTNVCHLFARAEVESSSDRGDRVKLGQWR